MKAVGLKNRVLYANNQNNGFVYLLEIICLLCCFDRSGDCNAVPHAQWLAVIESSHGRSLKRRHDVRAFGETGWRRARLIRPQPGCSLKYVKPPRKKACDLQAVQGALPLQWV